MRLAKSSRYAGIALLMVQAASLCANPNHVPDPLPVPLPAELSGCWQSVDGERRITEVWFSPAANRMIGISETREGGTSVAWEFLRIERDGDSLVFRALPSGQMPTEFPLLSSSGGELVFENLQHDFPQRVVYPIPAGTELRARIEGPAESGATRVIPFTYQRIDCAGLWHAVPPTEIPD